MKAQHNTDVIANPLDSVEDIFLGYDWDYDRSANDELVVHVSGEKCHYTMIFIWQKEFGALQFSCLCDVAIPQNRSDEACQAFQSINEQLWLGHFEMSGKPMTPRFRYTMLFRHQDNESGTTQLNDLVDIALAECERHYDIFSMLGTSTPINDDVLFLELSGNIGQA